VEAQPGTVTPRCELPASLACSPGFLLSKIGLYVRTTFGQAMIDQGLRPPHYAVLVFLRQNASPPQTMLAQMLRIDRSDVVSLIDALEARGLVERRRDAGDRRRYALSLTADGEQLVERLTALARETEERIFAPLSPEEREQLLGLLSRLAAFHGIIGLPV
jgi:MarR family transcriptional regulator, lower aerobic nicotinate degradation pathway regulator